MAHFLEGNELNLELELLFENANESLVLISPYIKLHDRFISVLRSKIENPNLQIIIVFGKNEEDMSRSMKQEDFNFFKEFPNIVILYEKRLHAKYYANEKISILTSMNLYNFSQDNNIEAGVIFDINDKINNQATAYFERVIDQAELLYHRIPRFESKMLGFSKRYIESITEADKLTEFFSNKFTYSSNERFKRKSNVSKIQTTQSNDSDQLGYCIRTGKRIPFNPKHPMSADAYANWMQFKNQDYSEKFCHFSGEASHGETTFAKPILRKNWKAAKEVFGL